MKCKLKTGAKYNLDGRPMKVGEEIELSVAGYKALGDKFEPVVTKAEETGSTSMDEQELVSEEVRVAAILDGNANNVINHINGTESEALLNKIVEAEESGRDRIRVLRAARARLVDLAQMERDVAELPE